MPVRERKDQNMSGMDACGLRNSFGQGRPLLLSVIEKLSSVMFSRGSGSDW